MLLILKKTMKRINRVCEYVTAAMLVVMTLSILLQVCCRAFGVGFDTTEELARYLMIAIVCLGTGIGIHRGGNMGIEALVNAVSSKHRRMLMIASDVLSLVLFAEIARYGLRILPMVKRQTSASMQISMLIPYGIIYIACIIIFMHIALHLLELIFDWKETDKPSP